jgi:putative intracellular protease/amidase
MERPDSARIDPDWQPRDSSRFDFSRRALNPATGELHLDYRLGSLALRETLVFPAAPFEIPEPNRAAVDAALDLLHWTAGISYWKAACPPEIRFEGRAPDAWQAQWLERLYRAGLAEFAFNNGLDPEGFAAFPSSSVGEPIPGAFKLRRRSLVPMGGGKDSLVAWERLRAAGEAPDSVQIGSAPLIRALGEALPGRHWQIERHLDPALAEINRRGAWNGHVPVTAINSAILVVAALLLNYDRVVFANERSASEASRLDAQGRAINHQFSKSFEFEGMFADWIERYVHGSLRVFSLLRRDRELAICRDFAGLDQWHGQFSSCNRNFHLDGPRVERWCGHCPKCRFVFLCLAPFMPPAELAAIFGQDLLASAAQVDGFAELLALDGVKPFECVGEADEARSAVQALSRSPDWSGHAGVRALADRLEGQQVPELDELCRPGGPHRIPQDLITEELLDAL